MITQGITKELRASGVRGAILGNAKIIGETQTKTQRPPTNDDLDGLPF